MLYSLAADLVLVIHMAFVAFVVFGGLTALRWKRAAYVHLPIAVYGILIEFIQWTCPLTPLENRLRRAAGEAGYEGGFIAHYLIPVIYPGGVSVVVEFVFGVLLVAFNAGLYFFVWRKWSGRRAPALDENEI